MLVRPLQAADFQAIHHAFLDAFSDYTVPFQLTAEELAEMLRRRAYRPETSVGVFDGERLVAFTLNGVGSWRGERTGYDSGTGVVPSHRGRGLSRRMIDASTDVLRAQRASRYLLEVLQANEKALGVYRRAGFEITRELQCWTIAAIEPAGAPRATAVDDFDLARTTAMFDVAPSWQNSIEAVARAGAPRTMITAREGGVLAGAAVVFENGDVPFVAVDRAMRRRGIGRELIAAALRAAGRPLRLLNVEGDYGAPFLEACGAQRTVRQFEMTRAI